MRGSLHAAHPREIRMPDQPFRVLSLNGGGVRALFQAHFLNYLSKVPGIGCFREDFDLIIGTSAGAVVAAALWIKKPPEEIADLFENVGKDAFPQPLWNGLHISLRLAARDIRMSSLKPHRRMDFPTNRPNRCL
ncbi:MAG: patatin-like phospholipase family protein [Methylococcales bacterium]